MTPWTLSGSVGSGAALVQFVADLALKGALICSLAGLLALLLRRAAASLRDLVWRCALLVLLLVPVPALLAPAWELGILPDLTRISLPAGLPRNGDAPALSPVTRAERVGALGDTRPGLVSRWPAVVSMIVGLGCLLVLGRMLLARLQVQRIVSRALPLDTAWQQEVAAHGRLLGIAHPTRVRASPEIGAAITVGVLHPHIIVPVAAQRWPQHRRRAVIAHELAHVRRRDVLFEHLAALVTIIYWYQPLVWWALRQLRNEREHACDDLVLQCGVRPARYAVQLMQIAKGLTRPPCACAHVALLWRANLKERLRHILRAGVRRGPVSPRTCVAGLVVAAALTVPVAATGFWIVDREPLEGPPGVLLDAKAQHWWTGVADRRHSAAYLVERVLAAEGLDAAEAAFRRLTSGQTLINYYVAEREFNSLGYRLLYRNRLPEALAIFELNAGAFPTSWNVHDSLGEAYLAAGDLEQAHASYTRSLALGSRNAEKARHTLEDLAQRLGRNGAASR